MIQVIQKGLFDYISSLMSEYGLKIEFHYDPKLDVLEGFKKSIRLRVENAEVFTGMINGYKERISANHTLAVFSRTPLKRSSKMSNNAPLEAFFRDVNKDSTDIEFRNIYYGEVNYSIKVLFDDHAICDLFEIIYAFHLDGKNRSYQVDYDFGVNDSGKQMEPLTEVDYNVFFEPISSIDSLNESDLRYIDFNLLVEGPVFSPFYKGGGLLESIVVSIHAFNKSTPPVPANATADTLAETLVFPIKHDN